MIILNNKEKPKFWIATFTFMFLTGLVCAQNALAGSLQISWDPVQDSRVSGYKVKFGTTSKSYSQSVNVGNTTSTVLQNLTDGSTYYFVVVAYDSSSAEGSPSAEVYGTVLMQNSYLISSIKSNSAVISWQTNKPATGSVDYGLTTGYGLTVNTGGSLGTNLSCILSNLSPSKTYNYRIHSQDQGGSVSVSSNLTFTTPAVDTTPPTNVTNVLAEPGNGLVTLSWINPPDSDFKGVVVRYRTDGNFPSSPIDGTMAVDLAGLPGSAGSFLHSGLTNGTTYSYSIFAYDNAKNYSPSSSVQTTPFEVTILSMIPTQGNKGIPVSINGKGFGSEQGSSAVTFSGFPAPVSSWSDSTLTVQVPSDAISGPVVVTVKKVYSNGVIFKVGGKLAPPGRMRVKN